MDVGAVTEGGLTAALDGAEVIYNLGADEVEIAAGPVCHLSGQPRRPGRAPGRHHPAGCRLDGGERAVRQHRRAARNWRCARAFRPGEAKENWAILRALSAELGATLPWDSLAGCGARWWAHPHLGRIDEVAANDWQPLALRDPGKSRFPHGGADFYLTNPIARASALMAELSAMAADRAAAALAAE
jgi:NADH-quinone oxidoreductase subunit G